MGSWEVSATPVQVPPRGDGHEEAYLGDVWGHVLAKSGDGGAGVDIRDEQCGEEEGRHWHRNLSRIVIVGSLREYRWLPGWKNGGMGHT